MNSQLNHLARPLRVAVFEMQDDCALPNCFDQATPAGYAVVPAARSPAGYRWHELYVDQSAGTLSFHETAHTLVSRIVRAAEADSLAGFRLVDGTMYRQPLTQHRNEFGDDQPGFLMA